ncbi:MAG TPA: HTTM domain-containing protein [Acidimicrobiia bacterium]|nr:HTTM domain-containing protein [Acidimicrobiia bacterium]
MDSAYALIVERLFARFFGVALIAHVVGNWGQPDFPELVGFLNLLVGLGGLGLTVWPRRSVLQVASALVVASVLAEMPTTGNHWVVAGLAGLAILASRGDPNRYLPALRWIFLIFYGFSAFAKLNSGFFDPSVSCAVFYANQSLDGFGLGPLPAESPLRTVIIWLTAGLELAVVPMLLVKRTRFLGILMASAFHIIISFDLNQHFYDFTAVLLALLVPFLPDSAIHRVASRPQIRRARLLYRALLAVTLLLVLIAVLPPSDATIQILGVAPFIIWIPFALFFLLRLWRSRAPGTPFAWNLSWVTGLVALLTFFNGLTPYTELKTAYGFNMYANLVTAGGVSNHFLVPRTFPLRDGYRQPVEIISSSDPGLELYRDYGYLIAYPQFQRYLVGRSVSVGYRRGTDEYSLASSAGVADSGPWWWTFMPLRALDSQNPPRCQAVFLPAL